MTSDRTLRWRPLEYIGLEQVRVRQGADAIRMSGALIGETGGVPFSLFHEITLAPDRTFRSRLVRTGTDIDLSVSPLTARSIAREALAQSFSITHCST